MDTVTQIQVLGEAVCISHSTNTIGKSLNPTFLSLIIGK